MWWCELRPTTQTCGGVRGDLETRVLVELRGVRFNPLCGVSVRGRGRPRRLVADLKGTFVKPQFLIHEHHACTGYSIMNKQSHHRCLTVQYTRFDCLKQDTFQAHSWVKHLKDTFETKF